MKGKFYLNEKLENIYELINGNDKVKEYDTFDKLIYEGNYLNGIKIK